MVLYVGVTDENWYQQLSAQKPDEVNFWSPSGRPFKALQEGELFLFKLHAPRNYIVGGGFFVRFSALPPFLAWQAFGEKIRMRCQWNTNEIRRETGVYKNGISMIG